MTLIAPDRTKQSGTGATTHTSTRKRVTTLRVLGTSVTLNEEIRIRAEQDLGLHLKFVIQDGVSAQRQAVQAPDSFDVYDQWFHNLDFVWPARSIQAVETSRIDAWAEVGPLVKTGRLTPDAPFGAGSNPASRLYVQPDGTLGGYPTAQLSMLPVTHSADSFGYVPEHLPDELMDAPESWAWLLHPQFRRYAALQDDSSIGAIDAALAVQAAGLDRFADLGDLGVEEIDRLMGLLQGFRRRGHFAGFWSTVQESADLMTDGRVRIQSLWAPAAQYLRQRQVSFRVAAPKEGYRAWYGGMALSRTCTGRTLDAAYRYLNWWLSGWPGAVMARQGYFLSVPDPVREHLSAGEWDYWYAGKPAPATLYGVNGETLVRSGEVHSGGSYENRMGRVAVWNSAMSEHNYLVRRWSEFCRGVGDTR